MLGYFKPRKLDLTYRQYHQYHKYYCAVCVYLKRYYHPLFSFANSYESVFLSLLMDNEMEERSEKISCPLLLVIKRDVMSLSNRYIQIAAALRVYFSMLEVNDNITDDNCILDKVKRKTFTCQFDKAKSALVDYGVDVKGVEDNLSQLRERELNDTGRDFDWKVDPLCQAMGIIFEGALQISIIDQSTAYTLGYNTAKVLVIIDAIRDFWQDRKKGKSNPMNCLIENELDHSSVLRAGEAVKGAFNVCVRQMLNALSSLDLKNKSIVINIIALGLNDQFVSAYTNNFEKGVIAFNEKGLL